MTRTIQWVMLAAAVLSLLATLATFRDAIQRRRRLRERGVNGRYLLIANHRVRREVRRLVKHSLAVAGICVGFMMVPSDWAGVRTILFALICVGLTETSYSDWRHYRELDRMWGSE